MTTKSLKIEDVTLHLSPRQVEEALKRVLVEQGFDAHTITFDVKDVPMGYGQGETSQLEFSGATVQAKLLNFPPDRAEPSER